VPLSLVHHWLMPLFSFEGLEPVVSPAAWIAPTATLVGDVRVEDEASVWYGAVLRGNGATVLDGAVIGSRALVAAGATVPPGMRVPDGMLAAGVPARVVGELTEGARSWVENNPAVYRALAKRHAAGVRPAG